MQVWITLKAWGVDAPSVLGAFTSSEAAHEAVPTYPSPLNYEVQGPFDVVQ